MQIKLYLRQLISPDDLSFFKLDKSLPFAFLLDMPIQHNNERVQLFICFHNFSTCSISLEMHSSFNNILNQLSVQLFSGSRWLQEHFHHARNVVN